jgi:hypothetical protein
MPFPNEWAVRQAAPGKYDRFRRGSITKGVDAIYGRVKGSKKWEVQSYRFKKTRFKNKAQVRAWMKKNKVKGVIEEDGMSDDAKVVQLEAEEMNIQIQSDGKSVDGTSVTVNGTKVEDVQYASFYVERNGSVSLTVERKVKDDATGLSKVERLEYRSENGEEADAEAPKAMAEFRGTMVPLEELERVIAEARKS